MCIPGLLKLDRLPLYDPQDRRVDAWLIHYVSDDFDPAVFKANGITCPPSILRSVPRRQAEYFFGRLAAREALRAIGATTLDVHTGHHRQPVWPAGLIGSITHSQDHAAALVLERGPLTATGIDVEGVSDGLSLESLVKTAIDADELAFLRRFEPELDPATLVTLAFSAKESFFKAAYEDVGRYFDFTAVKLTSLDIARGRLTLEVRELLSAALVPGVVRGLSFGFLDTGILYTACLW